MRTNTDFHGYKILGASVPPVLSMFAEEKAPYEYDVVYRYCITSPAEIMNITSLKFEKCRVQSALDPD